MNIAVVLEQFAQSLGHEARLKPHVRIAHVTFELGSRHQGRNRIDDNHIDRTRPYQHVSDLKRLFTRIWLRDQQLVDVHSNGLCIYRIEGVFCIDECRRTAVSLSLGKNVERQRGLARRLRSEDLDYSTARHATYAKSEIQGEGTRWNHGHLADVLCSETHDGARAKLTLDLGYCHLEVLIPVVLLSVVLSFSLSWIPVNVPGACDRLRQTSPG